MRTLRMREPMRDTGTARHCAEVPIPPRRVQHILLPGFGSVVFLHHLGTSLYPSERVKPYCSMTPYANRGGKLHPFLSIHASVNACGTTSVVTPSHGSGTASIRIGSSFCVGSIVSFDTSTTRPPLRLHSAASLVPSLAARPTAKMIATCVSFVSRFGPCLKPAPVCGAARKPLISLIVSAPIHPAPAHPPCPTTAMLRAP